MGRFWILGHTSPRLWRCMKQRGIGGWIGRRRSWGTWRQLQERMTRGSWDGPAMAVDGSLYWPATKMGLIYPERSSWIPCSVTLVSPYRILPWHAMAEANHSQRSMHYIPRIGAHGYMPQSTEQGVGGHVQGGAHPSFIDGNYRLITLFSPWWR